MKFDLQDEIGSKVDNFLNDVEEEKTDEEPEIKRPPQRIIQATRDEQREERIRDLEAMEKGPKKSHALLVIAIVVAVLAAAAIAVLIYLNNKGKINIYGGETSTVETTTALEITCSIKDGGEYTAPVTIELKASGDCRIYYSMDGKRPNNRSERYGSPITITTDDIKGSSADYTFWAVAYNDTGVLLDEYKATIKVKSAELNAPVISPAGGEYSGVSMISISADPGTTIYYTTDGTVPTKSSPVYVRAFPMEKGTHTVQALAVKDKLESPVTSMTYNLTLAAVISQQDAEAKLRLYLKDLGILKEEETVETEPETEEETTEGESTTGKEKETTEEREMSWLSSYGTTTIDDVNYYVFLLEIYDGRGQLKNSGFYGVDDQNANIVSLYETDYGFAIAGND